MYSKFWYSQTVFNINLKINYFNKLQIGIKQSKILMSQGHKNVEAFTVQLMLRDSLLHPPLHDLS